MAAAFGPWRCQCLVAVTLPVRDFGGTRHAVTVAPEGFIRLETDHSNLTAIARIITGSNWNRPIFFGLHQGGGGKGNPLDGGGRCSRLKAKRS
jgi:hypothetical protein